MAIRKSKAAERGAAPIPRPAKARMTRADKLAATRSKLLTAATEIVGAEGYGNASVAKITARARVAQGTFYNYFESQQDLFDQLLPELGSRLLDHIRARIADCADGLKREEIGFRAFFEYLAETPQFYRVLNEAEAISPKAFRDHMSNMIQGYLRALQRSQEQGGLPGFGADEFEVVVCILLGARNYLAHHFMIRTGHVGPVPDWIVRAYMKFVAGGVMYGGTSRPTYRPKRAAANGGAGVAGAEGSRIVAAGNGGAVLDLRIRDAHRDPTGVVRRAVLFDLAASVAELAVGGERKPALLTLASNMLAPTHAGRLIASARCERRGTGAAHVAVTVHEDRRGGAAVLTAQATFIERTA
jgi:AcrR family transcriptional regulator